MKPPCPNCIRAREDVVFWLAEAAGLASMSLRAESHEEMHDSGADISAAAIRALLSLGLPAESLTPLAEALIEADDEARADQIADEAQEFLRREDDR